MANRRGPSVSNIFLVQSDNQSVGSESGSSDLVDPSEFPPPVDMHEYQGTLIIAVELPGVKAKDLRVAVSNSVIIVEGIKRSTVSASRVTYHCMERYYGRFSRVIEIPRAANLYKADAEFKNGVLSIRVPLVDDKRGQWKTISVK